MCVIIVKPHDVAIPEDVLDRAWRRNSDGAGFAIRLERGDVLVRKGFMKLKDLKAALANWDHAEVVLHLRLATDGSKGPRMTHPFAITPKVTECKLQADVSCFAKAVLFHNGIISEYGGGKVLSDSCRFVTELLAHIPAKHRLNALKLAGSKYALVTGKEVQLVGDFSKKAVGGGELLCSNLHWDYGRSTPSKQRVWSQGDRGYVLPNGDVECWDFHQQEWKVQSKAKPLGSDGTQLPSTVDIEGVIAETSSHYMLADGGRVDKKTIEKVYQQFGDWFEKEEIIDYYATYGDGFEKEIQREMDACQYSLKGF